jgi:hypothetical protein
LPIGNSLKLGIPLHCALFNLHLSDVFTHGSIRIHNTC